MKNCFTLLYISTTSVIGPSIFNTLINTITNKVQIIEVNMINTMYNISNIVNVIIIFLSVIY